MKVKEVAEWWETSNLLCLPISLTRAWMAWAKLTYVQVSYVDEQVHVLNWWIFFQLLCVIRNVTHSESQEV